MLNDSPSKLHKIKSKNKKFTLLNMKFELGLNFGSVMYFITLLKHASDVLIFINAPSEFSHDKRNNASINQNIM